jgi:hypothetical protein
LTTTTTETTSGWQQAADRRLAASTAMLERAGLELLVPPEQAAKALACAFNKHRIGTPHATLVGEAMTPRHHPESGRPLLERLIRDLVAHGQAPTARALQGAYQRHLAAKAGPANRRSLRRQRITPIAATTGPAAAQAVTNFWRQHGRGPSPCELARQVDGWRSADAWPLCERLIEDGWLAVRHGHLHSGPRALKVITP